MQIHRQPGMLSKVGKREWRLVRPFAIWTPFGPVLIHRDFLFNKDSVVRNSPDWVPSCVHDWLYVFQMMAWGRMCSRLEADMVYYVLNIESLEPYNRQVAYRNYTGVRAGGWPFWNWPGKPHQRPDHAVLLAQEYKAMCQANPAMSGHAHVWSK